MVMIGPFTECPPAVCLLADHLDTALAVGEDMLALSLPPRADLDERDPEAAPEAVEKFVQRLRVLEEAILARLLQARRRMEEVRVGDALLKSATNLFRVQTESLLQFINREDANILSRFDGSADSFAFLRSRGLISPEAAAPSPFESVDVTEAYLIGGGVQLGPVLDLVSGLLNLLDAKYSLYPVSPDDAETARIATAVTKTPRSTSAISPEAAEEASGGQAPPAAKAEAADQAVSDGPLSSTGNDGPAADQGAAPPLKEGAAEADKTAASSDEKLADGKNVEGRGTEEEGKDKDATGDGAVDLEQPVDKIPERGSGRKLQHRSLLEAIAEVRG